MDETVRLTMATSFCKVFRITMDRRDGEINPFFARIFGIFGHGNVAGNLIRLATPDSSIFHLRQPADISRMQRHLLLPFLPFHAPSDDLGYLPNHRGLINNHGL